MTTTDCPLNKFFKAASMDNIILVKINNTDFLWIFKDEIKEGASPFELSDLLPVSDTEIQTVINTMRPKVSGDWYKLLLLEIAQRTLDNIES